MCSYSLLRARRSLAAGAAAAALTGCSVPMQSVRLGPEAAPVEVEMMPGELREGNPVAGRPQRRGRQHRVRIVESVDRYWTAGPGSAPSSPLISATRPRGSLRRAHRDARLLGRAQEPAASRLPAGRCSEHYHEVVLRLPERNRRSVALTAGWNSVFARRSILGADRTVLFKEALTSGVWAMHGEWASGRWNAQAQGFMGGGEHGASLDVARMLMGGESLSYGIAMHVGMTHSDWLAAGPSAAPGRTAYRAGIGPSVMLKGITASSLLGIYSDGLETLQISSTRSINGNLTSVGTGHHHRREDRFAEGRSCPAGGRVDAHGRHPRGGRRGAQHQGQQPPRPARGAPVDDLGRPKP
jgi:hypothetical protein